MSLDPMPNLTASSSHKRVVIGGHPQDTTPANQPPTGSHKQIIRTESPKENALTAIKKFTMTLPSNLQDLVLEDGQKLFKVKAVAITTSAKANKITNDDDYLPKLCHDFGQSFKIMLPDKVMESEEYQTLSEEADTAIGRCRKALAEIINQGTKLTARQLDVEYAAKHCTTLVSLV